MAPIPEAPFVLLNVLSFGALVFLAWYSARRVPSVPRWVVYGLALTLPWTLHYSTHIVNPSYVLPGAVLFWIGATEALVFPDQSLLPPWLADCLLGFGLVWVMQLHMSWTLLVPFAALAWVARARRGHGLAALGGIALGSAAIGSLLLPTVLAYGLRASGNAAIAVRFNPINARDVVPIAARILSFASFELPRFIGPNYVQREAWVLGDLRIAPFALLAVAVGLAQPLLMAALFFRREGPAPGWARMKALAAGTILLTCASFLFTVREPWALTFYLTLPVAFLYSVFCYGCFLRGERWLALAAVVLASGLVTNTAFGSPQFRRPLGLPRARASCRGHRDAGLPSARSPSGRHVLLRQADGRAAPPPKEEAAEPPDRQRRIEQVVPEVPGFAEPQDPGQHCEGKTEGDQIEPPGPGDQGEHQQTDQEPWVGIAHAIGIERAGVKGQRIQQEAPGSDQGLQGEAIPGLDRPPVEHRPEEAAQQQQGRGHAQVAHRAAQVARCRHRPQRHEGHHQGRCQAERRPALAQPPDPG